MKIKAWCDYDIIGAKKEEELEIDDSELEGLDAEQRLAYIQTEASEWAHQYFEYGWKVI